MTDRYAWDVQRATHYHYLFDGHGGLPFAPAFECREDAERNLQGMQEACAAWDKPPIVTIGSYDVYYPLRHGERIPGAFRMWDHRPSDEELAEPQYWSYGSAERAWEVIDLWVRIGAPDERS